MTDIDILQQRLARAKAALRDEKKRAKAREDQLILSAVRRSGLTLIALEDLLAARAALDLPPANVPGDFSLDGEQS